MARICSVICASHSPWLFLPSDIWEDGRRTRFERGAISHDTPIDTPAENAAKAARVNAAYGKLREELEKTKPDVLLVFGDDQLEQFSFRNFPAFAMFTGDSYSGYKISRLIGLPVGGDRPERPKTPEHWVTVPSHPELSHALIRELMRDGFDLAFTNGLTDEDEGMGHAFMRPSFHLDPDYDIPTIPFYVNCYYGPQPTALRCYEVGRAVRAAIERIPLDLNVAIIGSGGLWHMPNTPESWLDESFDQRILEGMKQGDARATAAFFDSVTPPIHDARDVERISGGTGIVLGWGSGVGETRSWIAASACADGFGATVVDYIPIYASPIGVSFAYWEKVN